MNESGDYKALAHVFQRSNPIFQRWMRGEQLLQPPAKATRNMSIQCTVQERDLWLNIEGEALHIVPQVRK